MEAAGRARLLVVVGSVVATQYNTSALERYAYDVE